MFFMQIHLSISNLLLANPTFIKVVHFGWGQHLCKYQIIEKKIKSEKKPLKTRISKIVAPNFALGIRAF